MEVATTVSPYSQGLDVSNWSIEQLWPPIDPEFKPYGSKVMIQLRRTMLMSSGGIALTSDTGDTEAWNTQIGLVLYLGPLAFKNRKDGTSWPEGDWCKVGEFVRFPRWGGDRLTIKPKDGNMPITILILDDHHILGQYTGDPRRVRAFLD